MNNIVLVSRIFLQPTLIDRIYPEKKFEVFWCFLGYKTRIFAKNGLIVITIGAKYSIMDQVKFVEDSL